MEFGRDVEIVSDACFAGIEVWLSQGRYWSEEDLCLQRQELLVSSGLRIVVLLNF